MRRYVFIQKKWSSRLAVCVMIAALVSLSGCNNTKKSGAEEPGKTEQPVEKKTHKDTPSKEVAAEENDSISRFFPDIPSYLKTKEEQALYVFAHYWDKFPFNDKNILKGKDNIGEQHLANYLSFFVYGTPSKASVDESLKNFTDKMATHMETYEDMMEMLHKYLYNPNSPYYSEALLIKIMEDLIANPHLDEARKSSLRFKKQLMERNMPGTKASDFSYTTISGKSATLMGTKVGNTPLLLVFFDPNCSECHKTIEMMKEDSQLNNYIHDGKLMVLAVYTENEQSAWDKVPGMFPSLWMVGNDHGQIKEKALYDLKAMPTIYLLTPNKEVVLKDVPYPVAMNYLQKYN